MTLFVSQSSASVSPVSTGETLKLYIDGAFVDPLAGETFANINPATGALLNQVARGESADIELAVHAAKRSFEAGSWAKLPMKARCQKLRDLGDRILARRDALAMAETLDTGKPLSESLNGDIPRAAQNFHFFAEAAAQLSEECFTVDRMERHFSVREPLGVVGLITPWNLPLYLASWKIAPALVMGNSIVLKPAEWTPTTATLLAEIFQEAEIPPGVFNVVHGFGTAGSGEALTRHPEVKAISFTGETVTGKTIMKAAADSLKKISFELGGKGATVIFEDADLPNAIETAVKAAFRNQGQICLAGSRLFVQRSVLAEVLPQVLKQVASIPVGDPLQPETRMGSLISAEHYEKVMRYIELGRQEGQLLAGGTRLTQPDALAKGYFLEPTVFINLSPQSALCQEEIFGPVLPIIAFDTEEEAIHLVNDTPYGLSASVWSQDVNRCHRLSQEIRAGILWMNCWFARDLRTPFGGMKASGMGREGGRYALEFFSEFKTVCYRYQ
ncbi:aldehyde dehydrogenase [Vampirovibrio sp.]|uniref:aldehyde dehydrogenase n=1 Tax=Vampirovibrio sp. TaxID=2717857 RepID=UPI003592F780